MTISREDLSPGDEWPAHYRGFTLHLNPKRECWWQVYNDTERLELEGFPDDIIDALLREKPRGGRVSVTETGHVITRLDEDGDGDSLEDYTSIWLGTFDFGGRLVPQTEPDMNIDVSPDGLSTGDLWPSVYDGSRYSFTVQQGLWWHNPVTKQRHPVTTEISDEIWQQLRMHKPEGGSFRVTPANDVITLVGSPRTQTVKDQFGELPPIVRNIIKFRQERVGLDMLPVYIGNLGGRALQVKGPPSLTDTLTEEEEEALQGWAEGLGTQSKTTRDTHSVRSRTDSGESSEQSSETRGAGDSTEASGNTEDQEESADTSEQSPEAPPKFKDDPEEWLEFDKMDDRFDGG